MSPENFKPSLNPTVEEMIDEMSNHRNPAAPAATNFGLSWSQLCAQHDSVLSSHLKMLQTLKGEVSADTEAAKLVASMIERTHKLVLQFEGVKKHIVPRMSRGSESAIPASNASHGSREDTLLQKKKKRQRRSHDEIEILPESQPQEPIPEIERSKRKRVVTELPGADQDVQNFIPVALQTEDISEEVNRRLKIKEDMRRKRHAKPEKRKRDRDSLASNASTSSLGLTKSRKKIKRGEHDDRARKRRRSTQKEV